MSTSKPQAKKERGTWLSSWLIFIMVHGIIATILVGYLQQQGQITRFPWALPVLVALSLADIVAGIAAWFWKKWGLTLYAIATVVGIVVGLIATASQLIVFHDIIPLVILGFLVKDKLEYFDPGPSVPILPTVEAHGGAPSEMGSRTTSDTLADQELPHQTLLLRISKE